MKKTILAASIAAALSLTQQIAFAEDDAIIVTATRTAQTVDETLASVSVVTKEDIQRYQFKTVAEAINSLPGVVIANSGGLGKQTSIFLRGTESNHTQIILNGMKLATNAFGAPQIEHIPLNLIERIELVRGPQSSLYGSGSIGGTIQIFTKKGSGKLTPHFSVGFGTHDTKETTFGISGGNASNWYSLSGGYTETNGFNSCYGKPFPSGFGCFTTEPDKDAYRNSNASLRVGHRFSNNAEVEFFSLYSEGESEFDGSIFSGNQTDFLQHTFGTKLTTNITDSWSITATLSQGRIEADNNKDGVDVSFSDNKQDHFSLQNDIQLNDAHLLTIGYDYEDDKIEGSSSFSTRNRHSNAVFSQLLGEYGVHNYQVALRAEDDEQFGSNTTGNIAWGMALSDNLRLTTSFGTAFVAPSLIDLYNPPSFGFATSTPDLDPERSKTYEIGLRGQHASINWSANIYQTEIKDLIVLDATNGFTPQNISEARLQGLELQAATQLAGIDVDGQFSWVNPEDKSGSANDGNVLARRAEQTFTLNANKSFGDFSVASKVFVSGRRFDNAANTRRIAGFTTVDLVGAYKINSDLTAQVKVANVFNEEYETVSGFNTDGTNIFFSINYQPAN
ncbi:MAG: TonB-dependent receptor [Piscirickettsiaceae bacterium]|nr:MAG: TonB-dependent receptor [Piscirickettsiaceae bacterium]PCI65725.1 MAG: TonB-dependent receptor [Piscirickettsiaceae bacterium]